jgi:gluconolactonase
MDRQLDRDWERDVVRYPDPAVEVIDPRFRQYVLGTAGVERLYTGARWSEGPVWFGDGRYLLWSDIPNNRILRWSEETGEVREFRRPSNNANGNTRDKQGRLISCEHGTRRVTRTEYDGSITVVLDQFEGKRLNAPNDVVAHKDGHIWFTDPGYGILMNYEGNKAPFELPTNVYRVDPETGAAAVVTDAPEKPNGLCFSPDYGKLYVVDTGASHKPNHPHQILVYDVEDNSRLTKGRVFCDMGPSMSDGIRCDIDGNLWSSAGWGGEGGHGVFVFAPDGDLIGKIHLPETAANLCFGGAKRNRLFIAASQSLYSLYVETQGAQTP